MFLHPCQRFRANLAGLKNVAHLPEDVDNIGVFGQVLLALEPDIEKQELLFVQTLICHQSDQDAS